MKRLLLAAIVTMAVTGPAWAQSSTATTTGVARSSSNSGAFAGSGNSSSSLVINNPANTTSTVNSNVSGTTTSNVNYSGGTRSEQVVSGTTTVRNAPGIVAPGLSAAGLETCLVRPVGEPVSSASAPRSARRCLILAVMRGWMRELFGRSA